MLHTHEYIPYNVYTCKLHIHAYVLHICIYMCTYYIYSGSVILPIQVEHRNLFYIPLYSIVYNIVIHTVRTTSDSIIILVSTEIEKLKGKGKAECILPKPYCVYPYFLLTVFFVDISRFLPL